MLLFHIDFYLILLGSNDSHFIKTELLKLSKWLTIMDANEILEIESNYKAIFQDKQEFIKVVEDLYLFWRRIERYTIIHTDKVRSCSNEFYRS